MENQNSLMSCPRLSITDWSFFNPEVYFPQNQYFEKNGGPGYQDLFGYLEGLPRNVVALFTVDLVTISIQYIGCSLVSLVLLVK